MRTRLAAIATFLACCMALQGCGTTSVGQGPIVLGPKVQAQYDEYRRSIKPGAFVISNQGAYYTYCPSTDCRPGSISRAMQLCQSHTDAECHLYDVGGQVVWRRDLPAPGDAAAVTANVLQSEGAGTRPRSTAPARSRRR